MQKRLFTIKELAEATGYTKIQLWRQVHLGNIRLAFKSKRVMLIDRAEFDRIVNKALRYGKYWTFKRKK